jgi:protein phosphatase
MGGAAAGEIASSLAVDETLNYLSRRIGSGVETENLAQLAEEAIGIANDAIYKRAERNYKLSGMGTTLVGLIVDERRVLVFNVGDSRCYLLRNSKIQQLTMDHSLVEEQVRLGRMTHSEALRSPLKNVITRALGTQSRVTPDVFEREAEPGDLFLLCSDGLTRELSDTKIESVLRSDLTLAVQCSKLVEAAMNAGGNDNITCLLVRVDG